MTLSQDIITKLQSLIGIDMNIAKTLFAQYGIKPTHKNKDGFSENLIALILDRALPGTRKGSDFIEFEVKQIKCKRLIKSKELRALGDTPIANFEDGNFFDSNCWDKTKSIIVVCIINDMIEDIRLFNGKSYKSVMEKDWELIQAGLRVNTQMFALKGKWNQIQMKKHGCIKLSNSLTEGVNNNIINQKLYCSKLFEANLSRKEEEFKVKQKDNSTSFETFLNRKSITINDLMKFRELIDTKIEDAMGFKDIKDVLTF